MKIVFISREYPPSMRLGGIGAHVKTDAEALAKLGHEVIVIAASDDTRREWCEVENDVTIIRLRGGDFLIPSAEPKSIKLKKLRMIYRFYSYRKRILNVIKKIEKIDIIEVCEYGAEAFYLTDFRERVVLRLATPTLLDRNTLGIKRFHLSKWHEYWIGKQEVKLMAIFPHVTSCCHALASWCHNNVMGFPPNYKVIFNPVDLSKWLLDDDGSYEENSILFAGTVSEAKGVGDLLEACNILKQKGTPIKLTIAGKLGSYAVLLKKHCEECGYDWCHFTGPVNQEELKRLYSTNKISCFPSWWEAFANVVIEAMAAGNIIVGSDNGGMIEIIDNECEGFLVSPKNPVLLSRVLSKALSLSKKEVQFFRHRAHQRLIRQVSTDVIVSQMETYYQQIVSENSRK